MISSFRRKSPMLAKNVQSTQTRSISMLWFRYAFLIGEIIFLPITFQVLHIYMYCNQKPDWRIYRQIHSHIHTNVFNISHFRHIGCGCTVRWRQHTWIPLFLYEIIQFAVVSTPPTAVSQHRWASKWTIVIYYHLLNFGGGDTHY